MIRRSSCELKYALHFLVTASGTVSANEINATSIKKGGTELATVAVTGAFSDITGGPTQLSDLADDLNVLVPGDNVGTLTNNVGYLTYEFPQI